MSKQKTRVLLTGASGKVGQRLAPLLMDSFELKFTDAKQRPGSPEPLHVADLTDLEQTCRIVQGVDAVVHMAIAAVRDFAGEDVGALRLTSEQQDAYGATALKVNTNGTYNVFEASRRAGIKKVVFFSSVLTVMGQPSYLEIGPKTPPRPSNLYACTKLFGESMGEFYSRSGMSVICLRLGQPYPGIYPWEEEDKKILKKRPMLVAIEDVAHAVECALKVQDIPFGIYYVLSDHTVPRIDISASEEIGYRPRMRFMDDGRVVPVEGRTAKDEGQTLTSSATGS